MFSYQQSYEYLRTASSSYTGKLHRTAVPGRSSTLSVIDSSGAIKNTVSSDVWLWSNFLISNKSTFVINLTNNFVVLSRDSNNRQKVFFFYQFCCAQSFDLCTKFSRPIEIPSPSNHRQDVEMMKHCKKPSRVIFKNFLILKSVERNGIQTPHDRCMMHNWPLEMRGGNVTKCNYFVFSSSDSQLSANC